MGEACLRWVSRCPHGKGHAMQAFAGLLWTLVLSTFVDHGMCCDAEKSQREEDRMMYEHQKEVQELRKEMREKDSLLDDLTQNNEVQLQVRQCHSQDCSASDLCICAFYRVMLC